MQYQNIWIRDLEDGLTTFVMTLDLLSYLFFLFVINILFITECREGIYVYILKVIKAI